MVTCLLTLGKNKLEGAWDLLLQGMLCSLTHTRLSPI